MARGSAHDWGVFPIGSLRSGGGTTHSVGIPDNVNPVRITHVTYNPALQDGSSCMTPPVIPRDVLPSDALERKTFPIASGVLDYFPDAIAAIAHLSWKGNDQHNPGEPLHWAREKSPDHADTLMRHFMERGKVDIDGERHSTKMAWRALALLQLELEQL